MSVPVVADLDEAGLLARITPLLPSGRDVLVGPGDDCAVLAAPDGRYCVSTDVLVEGRHFRTDWSSGFDVGARAAAQNLADIAAMGARPVALVACLVLPGATPVDWVVDLARGMALRCREAGAAIVGGDLSAGEGLVVAVTVHGDLRGRAPVLRSGARAGEALVLAGAPGRAAAGLALLEAGWGRSAAGWGSRSGGARRPDGGDRAGTGALAGTDAGADPAASAETGAFGADPAASAGADASAEADAVLALAEACAAAFRAPRPPLEAGPALAEIGASAMMDVSDSLVRDCGRIALASGVVIDIDDPDDDCAALAADRAQLEGVAALVPGTRSATRGAEDGARPDPRGTARNWVLTGGEDHGVLATVPADAVRSLPKGARVIGRVRRAGGEGPGVLVGTRPWSGARGWDHFRA